MSDTDPGDALAVDVVRATLTRQYHAALATMRDVVEACPDELWLDPRPTNAFWQVAYHALYFTHLYLARDEAAFEPWPEHVADAESLHRRREGDGAGPPPARPEPYTKAQVLAYWAVVDAAVDGAVAGFDLHRTESGFHWYPVTKLEHQLINIRHVQHHAAQLADRLRAHGGIRTRWMKTHPPHA